MLRRTVSEIVLTLLLTVTLILTANIRLVKTDTTPIIVPDDYPTIQEAINNANEGDIIFVKNGTYHESLIVDKTLSLIGENANSTIINGDGIGSIIYITANNVQISNFQISFGGIGINIDSANATIIANNLIDHNGGKGISLQLSHNNIIAGNIISNTRATRSSIPLGAFRSNGSLIYHNSFVNNIWDPGKYFESYNVWDNGYPSGGNYWDKYAGVDFYTGAFQNESGSDGIGDNACFVCADNIDYYPLMKPYGGPHDIGITELNKTKTVLGFDFNMNISIKIVNYGLEPETFNVTVYANETMILDPCLMSVTLSGRKSTTLTFVFNTDWMGFSKGNYSLRAIADTVLDETDIADNNFTDGWIYFAMKGDLTGNTTNPWDFVPDGAVDGSDLIVVSRCFGLWSAAQPPLNWNANCDITNDNVIDGSDVIIVARHYGEIGS